MEEGELKQRLRVALITPPTGMIDEVNMIDDVTEGFGIAFAGPVKYGAYHPLTFAMDPEQLGDMSVSELTSILEEVLREKLPQKTALNVPERDIIRVFVRKPEPGGMGPFSDKVQFNVNSGLLDRYRDIVSAELQVVEIEGQSESQWQAAASIVQEFSKALEDERASFRGEGVKRQSKSHRGYTAMRTYDALVEAAGLLLQGEDPTDLSGELRAALTDKNATSYLKRDMEHLGNSEFGKMIQLQNALDDIRDAVREKGDGGAG